MTLMKMILDLSPGRVKVGGEMKKGFVYMKLNIHGEMILRSVLRV